eukprot:CAMPEP_0114507644 /NCGR_PEP_ID=MMETSP0109-20121206/12130_1 /TAXON_ID=29199 /ORGANISM="Chlorarachnion reptans, Strain CCCM449" /LENGTH=355 /DNA_ID=CAMNT_0001686431 /DNA_START=952 /DNA_END=2019 /DNA_ORIENTATION=+
MEYSTFNALQQERKRKVVNCKKVALAASVAVNVALILMIGYYFAPRTYDARPQLGLGTEAPESYAVADEDKDGEVSQEELHEMIEKVMHEERAHEPGKMMMMIHGMLPEVINAVDQDGSGRIDMREAAQAMGMMPQMMGHMMLPGHARSMNPAEHAEFQEVQNRVKNEFKDAVLDLALKNARNESLSKEECFGNCFHRCRWMLDPHTCVDTCNKGCGTEAEIFDPMEHIAKTQAQSSIRYGENEKNYTLTMKKPGLKAKDLFVEVRGPVLVIRGTTLEQHRMFNITHQFMHMDPIPFDVNKEEISSDLENEILTVTLPKDPKLTKELEEKRKQMQLVAEGTNPEAKALPAPNAHV